MTDKETKILIHSLEMIAEFYENPLLIHTASEFEKIHKRNIDSLKTLSKERDTAYFIKEVAKYPQFTQDEIKEFVEKSEVNKGNILLMLGGPILALFGLIFNTVKTKGNNLKNTKSKLRELKTINDKLAYVVKNPGFEEMIDKN
jgi:hypothetical protein